MSFSSAVKNEICRVEVKNDCCPITELTVAARTIGIKKNKSGIFEFKVTTENAAFARKIFSLAKSVQGIEPKVIIRRNVKLKKNMLYIITVNILNMAIANDKFGIFKFLQNDFLSETSVEKFFNGRMCCVKAYLRIVFLTGGSISHPEKTYHLEIVNKTLKLAKEISSVMKFFDIRSKIIERKGHYIVYIKDGEDIVDFLNIIGAHSSLMELENVRILKEMRNRVNRVVNCETANLEKTVEASVRQVQVIEYIIKKIGIEGLPDNLREIAELRLKNRGSNLKELGQMCDPEIGKSGVNHRLSKLERMAEKLGI